MKRRHGSLQKRSAGFCSNLICCDVLCTSFRQIRTILTWKLCWKIGAAPSFWHPDYCMRQTLSKTWRYLKCVLDPNFFIHFFFPFPWTVCHFFAVLFGSLQNAWANAMRLALTALFAPSLWKWPKDLVVWFWRKTVHHWWLNCIYHHSWVHGCLVYWSPSILMRNISFHSPRPWARMPALPRCHKMWCAIQWILLSFPWENDTLSPILNSRSNDRRIKFKANSKFKRNPKQFHHSCPTDPTISSRIFGCPTKHPGALLGHGSATGDARSATFRAAAGRRFGVLVDPFGWMVLFPRLFLGGTTFRPFFLVFVFFSCIACIRCFFFKQGVSNHRKATSGDGTSARLHLAEAAGRWGKNGEVSGASHFSAGLSASEIGLLQGQGWFRVMIFIVSFIWDLSCFIVKFEMMWSWVNCD